VQKVLINDTVSIEVSEAENWLSWMRTIVLPLAKNSKSIESYRLTKIRDEEAQSGITYACQFICPDNEAYSDFINNFDLKFQNEQLNRFRGKFGAFRSVLEILDEG